MVDGFDTSNVTLSAITSGEKYTVTLKENPKIESNFQINVKTDSLNKIISFKEKITPTSQEDLNITVSLDNTPQPSFNLYDIKYGDTYTLTANNETKITETHNGNCNDVSIKVSNNIVTVSLSADPTTESNFSIKITSNDLLHYKTINFHKKLSLKPQPSLDLEVLCNNVKLKFNSSKIYNIQKNDNYTLIANLKIASVLITGSNNEVNYDQPTNFKINLNLNKDPISEDTFTIKITSIDNKTITLTFKKIKLSSSKDDLNVVVKNNNEILNVESRYEITKNDNYVLAPNKNPIFTFIIEGNIKNINIEYLNNTIRVYLKASPSPSEENNTFSILIKTEDCQHKKTINFVQKKIQVKMT